MATIVAVVLGAILVIGVAGYALGLFRFVFVTMDDQKKDTDDAPPDFSLPQENAPPDLDDGISLKEKMGRSDGKSHEEAGGQKPVGEEEDSFDLSDLLTGFHTGRGWLIDCQKTLNAAKAAGEIYAAVYFDFDRFRFINSLRGASIGDYVLTRLSQELEFVFPESSKITRISADHFAALCPLTGMEMFGQFAAKFGEICQKLQGDVASKSGLRICMGAALTDAASDYDILVLLHKANIARHTIKVSRSESWKRYEDSMITTWLYGESALEDYSENQYNDEFVLYFTPQKAIDMLSLSGCEALVRWTYEDNATKVLPYSLSKSKLPTNSSEVLYQTCKAMSRWRKAGKSVPVTSVSIPVTQFYKEDLDGLLGRCLSEFQLEPGSLAIVVEASIIRLDWSTASRQIAKLRDIGVQVGVDEIDTGYSDLGPFSGIKLDFFKLHRSFVAGVDQDAQVQSRLKQMLEEARRLGSRVILEGVDHKEHLSALHQLGAQYVQGTYCSAPLTADKLAEELPDYVEKHLSEDTVILDDDALWKSTQKK